MRVKQITEKLWSFRTEDTEVIRSKIKKTINSLRKVKNTIENPKIQKEFGHIIEALYMLWYIQNNCEFGENLNDIMSGKDKISLANTFICSCDIIENLKLQKMIQDDIKEIQKTIKKDFKEQFENSKELRVHCIENLREIEIKDITNEKEYIQFLDFLKLLKKNKTIVELNQCIKDVGSNDLTSYFKELCALQNIQVIDGETEIFTKKEVFERFEITYSKGQEHQKNIAKLESLKAQNKSIKRNFRNIANVKVADYIAKTVMTNFKNLTKHFKKIFDPFEIQSSTNKLNLKGAGSFLHCLSQVETIALNFLNLEIQVTDIQRMRNICFELLSYLDADIIIENMDKIYKDFYSNFEPRNSESLESRNSESLDLKFRGQKVNFKKLNNLNLEFSMTAFAKAKDSNEFQYIADNFILANNTGFFDFEMLKGQDIFEFFMFET